MSSYQYRKSHCGDKTVVRLSYLHNGISYTDKITSLYWISPLGILLHISLKFVPKGAIDNKSVLVLVMAWHRPGDKPLSEPMLTWFTGAICCTRVIWDKYLTSNWNYIITLFNPQITELYSFNIFKNIRFRVILCWKSLDYGEKYARISEPVSDFLLLINGLVLY